MKIWIGNHVQQTITTYIMVGGGIGIVCSREGRVRNGMAKKTCDL